MMPLWFRPTARLGGQCIDFTSYFQRSRRCVATLGVAMLVGCSSGATATTAQGEQPPPQDAAGPAHAAAKVGQPIHVTVGPSGYDPGIIYAKAGQPLRLIFTRTTKSSCGEEVVIPAAQIKRSLPVNEPVTVTFTPKGTKPLSFACGMNMLKGQIILQ